MAVKLIATHYNFEGNEIQNVSLQKLATDSSIENLKDGMIWLDTVSKKINFMMVKKSDRFFGLMDCIMDKQFQVEIILMEH